MTITRNFKLCLNAGTQNAPYINANQYDEGEEWVFDLYTEGGQKFTPSTGAIIGIKSDGHAILNSGTVNSDGQVVITETQQMTAASGLAVFELLIEGETHGTANFIVNVERRPSDDAEFSDSDLSMLQEAIDAAEVINKILDEGGDPSEIITENVNAWLDNHPEATTTVQDGAITAPKINNSLWDKLLVSESASGNPASFSDGADDVPVSSLKVALEPIQLGSGDPSPTNIRPIIASNGKNLLQVTATTQTISGVTFTVDNGIITANGTATAEAQYAITFSNLTGNYYFSGCPSGGSNTTYELYAWDYTASARLKKWNGTTASDSDFGTENNEINIPSGHNGALSIRIRSGYTANNLVFKPMIRPASITDASYQPYQGIMVANAGINQWDEQWELGSYDSNTTTIVKINDTTHIRSKNPIPVGAGKTYYMNTAGYNVHIAVADKDKNILWSSITLNNGTFTVPANGAYAYFNTAAAYGTTYNNDISINYPSTDTEYHAYTGTSYPYTLGQSVYGGTVDLATGVLTMTHGIVDMGTLTYTYRNSFGMQTNGLSATIKNPSDNNKPVNAISSIAKAGSWTVLVNSGTASGLFGVSGGYLGIATTETNPTTFKTAVTGQTICYELVEPQTIQLTPTQVKTLLGYNNISSTGTVDVIYHADTKLYIDKRIAELG